LNVQLLTWNVGAARKPPLQRRTVLRYLSFDEWHGDTPQADRHEQQVAGFVATPTVSPRHPSIDG
jgi:hypothetical protein